MTWSDLAQPLVNMTAIVVVRYLAVAATLYALLWRRTPQRSVRLSRRAPTGAQVRGEIALSVGSSVIYAAPAAFRHAGVEDGRHAHVLRPVARGLAVAHGRGAGLPAAPRRLLLLVAPGDALEAGVQGVPRRPTHRHPEPSPFAGFAFDPLEALLTGWFLPALVFVIPMEVHLAVALLLVVTVTGTINHCGWEVWPRRWVEGAWGRWGRDPGAPQPASHSVRLQLRPVFPALGPLAGHQRGGCRAHPAWRATRPHAEQDRAPRQPRSSPGRSPAAPSPSPRPRPWSASSSRSANGVQ